MSNPDRAIMDSVENWPDAEVERQFEKMLDDMNLTEEKKEPLRRRNIKQKREMLKMQHKGTVQQTRLKFTTGSDYVNYLRNHKDQSRDKLMNCLESLRIALSSNPLSWVKEFGKYGGLEIILDILEQKLLEPTKNDSTIWHATFGSGSLKMAKDIKIRRELLLCISKFMNNTVS